MGKFRGSKGKTNIAKTKLHRDIERVLQDEGANYEIVAGGRHRQVLIDGVLIGVFSASPGNGTDGKNVIAKIRKHCREDGKR